MSINYTPPNSLLPFLTTDNFVGLQVGPIGSTKSTAGLMKIVRHAKLMAPCVDGIRRSRVVWVRRSRRMLYDTSIKDFLSWFPPGKAGHWRKSDDSFVLRFDDVECEVMFRPLEDSADVNRVLSLNISGAALDEFREISMDVYEALQGRLGRYPDKRLVPPRPEWGVDEDGYPIGGCVRDDGSDNKHMWGMTNPPDADTPWEELLTEPPANVDVFFQPSALSPEADWLQYLPSGYYRDLMEGKSEEYIDVYVRNLFGKSLAGKPVFQSYDADTHVAKEKLRVLKGQPVIIGVDAGLTPAATFGQVSYSGQLLVYRSVPSENMGALRFIREKIKPMLLNDFLDCPVSVSIDPAAKQRAQTDERTVMEMFRNEGLAVQPAPTNSITARLAAVEDFLTRTSEGKPAIILDPEGTRPLQIALRSKYRYKIRTNGEVDDKPDKTHPWSDIADSLQYLCLAANGGGNLFGRVAVARRPVKRSRYLYA